MNNFLRRSVSFVVVLTFAVVVGAAATAQDKKMDDKMMAHDGKPIVAIIRADWCPACRNLEPTMKELMAQYGDRLNFVVLDVTNEETSKEAAATAEKFGLSKFFADNKGKTSTVAVFDAKKKAVFKTAKNFDRAAYVRAFDSAIEKNKMQG